MSNSGNPGFVDFERRAGAPVVVLRGDIDFSVGQGVDDALLGEYQTDGTLVVDLAAVTFLDSTGISLLLRLRQVAGEVRLDHLPARLRRMLELTGVEGLFAYGDPVDA